MKAQRPYLFDAIYRWILDNDFTPYLLVDARLDGVHVPRHLVQDGRIVLNLSPSAIVSYQQSDFEIGFSARFSGKSESISVPFLAMNALYAKENSQGIVFPQEDLYQAPEEGAIQAEESTDSKVSTLKKEVKKPSLKIIK